MLERYRDISADVEESASASKNADTFRPAEIASFFRRNATRIIAWMALAIALAVAYCLTATPLFTATAQLLLDDRRLQLFQDAVVSDGNTDEARVESQVQIMLSETVAMSVIKTLGLLQDPEFSVWEPGLLDRLLSFGASRPEPTEDDILRLAIGRVLDNLKVRRVGTTHVVEIRFRSVNNVTAARVANAVADAYINEQLNSTYDAARKAGDWLQARLGDLRAQSSAAQRAVQDYRSGNNLIEAGSRGRITDQKLAELTTQIGTAQSQLADARARMEQIQSILDGKLSFDAGISEALKNDVINKLRQQYADLRVTETQWVQRYGPSHSAVVRLREQIDSIRNGMSAELRRVLQVAHSEYDIAKAREESLNRDMQELVRQATKEGVADVQLKDLESNSQAYRTIFDAFLQKYTEAVQQQSLPSTDARLITKAMPPQAPSHPQTKLLVLLAIFGGAGIGIAHALLLAAFDSSIRTPEQLTTAVGANCLTLIPQLRGRQRRHVAVLQNRLSHFSDAVRVVKTSIDLHRLSHQSSCIGIVSAHPSEGKSTLASNLAHLLAVSGSSVLLIDADLRNPSLTRLFTPQSKAGLVEVLAGEQPLASAMNILPESGLYFIPASSGPMESDSADILGGENFRKLIGVLRNKFNLIIVDFAPLGPVVDARAASPALDTFILVAEWGRTKSDILSRTAKMLGRDTHILGAILNKVDFSAMRRFDSAAADYYASPTYKSYRK